jgi:hypothetical protein
MVKKINRNGRLRIHSRSATAKPKSLPKSLQGGGRMYSSTYARQGVEVEVTTEKSGRSVMSVKEKVEFIKKHGTEAFLELPL